MHSLSFIPYDVIAVKHISHCCLILIAFQLTIKIISKSFVFIVKTFKILAKITPRFLPFLFKEWIQPCPVISPIISSNFSNYCVDIDHLGRP